MTVKNVNRKVQGMPQSQTTANPRHQEEVKKDKNIHAKNKQTNVLDAQRPAPSSPSEVIRKSACSRHFSSMDFSTIVGGRPAVKLKCRRALYHCKVDFTHPFSDAGSPQAASVAE